MLVIDDVGATVLLSCVDFPSLIDVLCSSGRSSDHLLRGGEIASDGLLLTLLVHCSVCA